MPVRLRFNSKHTTPGRVAGFSTTVIGWPMAIREVSPSLRWRAMPPARTREPIPWRVIFASILSVVVAFGAIGVLRNLGRILTWLVIAGFFAVILTPPVDFLVRKLRFRRALATLVRSEE